MSTSRTLHWLALTSLALPPALRAQVDFHREVRPLLADKCLACHGPDEKARRGGRAGLRLDRRVDALAALDDDGRAAIVPGDAQASELVRRTASDDPRFVMPPPRAKKPLTPEERALLARWIDEGADWPAHWAFRAPEPTPPPPVADEPWSLTAIDRFLRARMQRAGVDPMPPADPRTLARRVAFDLTGLPPDPDDVERFVAHPDERAWERLVDRALADPAHAERLAALWLDLVRYADTTGIHGDNEWDAWPYRDWVIQAFARNLPFDEFTRAQLAGDLLPDATQDDRIAASYNRLNLITREGGSQPKEFLARYAADRVRNAGSVWLGTTLGCAECHDHKFDPITTREFYRFAAFFADIEQVGVYQQEGERDRYFGPYLTVTNDEAVERLAAFERELAALERELAQPSEALERDLHAWLERTRTLAAVRLELGTWYAAGPYRAGSFRDTHRRSFAPEEAVALDARDAEGRPVWTARPEWKDGVVHPLQGDDAAFYLTRTLTLSADAPLVLHFGSDDAIRVWLDGEEIHHLEVTRGVALDQDRVARSVAAGEHRLLLKITNARGGFGFAFRAALDVPSPEIRALVARDERDLSEEERARLAAHHRELTPLLAERRAERDALRERRDAFRDALPVVIATVAREPMVTRVLPRGNWMDESGAVVEPGVPAVFGALDAGPGRATRLDLADWLVRADHPVVARVFVNRIWKLLFGRGIVTTLDDFGTQGGEPSHPELLDHLALEFVRDGWDVRALVRRIVLTRAYRQRSDVPPAVRARDPRNDLFARQGRFRLDAESVRDLALCAGGLLSTPVGGRSVRPYQPEGLYAHLNFPKRTYRHDEGEQLWRRSLYTHWQRQFLHPTLAAFDAPAREECTAARHRSNTPQQALVLLNDPIFVEAARALATRALREAPARDDARLAFLFRAALQREPVEAERETLSALLEDHRAQYAADAAAARALIAIGEHPVDPALDAREVAAWTSVARVLLSLHETLTRS